MANAVRPKKPNDKEKELPKTVLPAALEFTFKNNEKAKSYYAIIREKSGEIKKIIGITVKL